MIPEYNKINFETDDLMVVEAKKKILEEAVKNGQITQEEFEAERARVLKAYEDYQASHQNQKLSYAFNWDKLGYAFEWLKSTYNLAD